MRPLTIFFSHATELFTDHKPHGDGSVAYEFVSRLAARGHRVHVAAERFELERPLHANVTTYLIPYATSSSVKNRISYALATRRLLRQIQRTEKVDIIHQLNPVTIGLSLGLIGTGLPLVLGSYASRWINDPDAVSKKLGLFGPIAEAMRGSIGGLQQRLADAILITTPSAENQIHNRELLAKRVHLLPYGLDCNRYCPAPDWDDPERRQQQQNKPVILFLASLARRKGIFPLLEAFTKVAAAFPNCTLRIVGNGAEAETVHRIAQESSAAAQIEFLPAQPRSVALELYRGATIFCAPSLGEPFGLAPIEAMACGIPVVATAAGGQLHTLNPKGGIHVPVDDSPALASALIRLLGDPELRRSMSLFNRKWVEEQFSWDAVIPRLESIYSTLLSNHPR